MHFRKRMAVLMVVVELLILPFLLLLCGAGVIGTLLTSGLRFPSEVHFGIFVMVLSTTIYLGIGFIYGLVSFWRIRRVPGVSDLFKGEDRKTIAMVLLQGAKATMIQWPYLLFHLTKKHP